MITPAREPSPTWLWCLRLATATLGLFGLLSVLLPSAIANLYHLMIFGRTWLPPEFGVAAAAYLSFVYGVLGAVLLGWAVLMLLIVEGPFRRGEREGWSLLAVPLLVWFVVDSTWSIASGYWQNAVLNSVFALPFAVALGATWRHFYRP